MNENFYQYMSVPCINLHPNFYCPIDELTNGPEGEDCIFQLLQLTSTHGNCQHTPVRILKDVTQQIDEGHYIVIFPNQTKIKTMCAEQNDFVTLKGNYLINLPLGCQFQTSERSFINKKITTGGKPMLLPEVRLPHSSPTIDLPKITIKDVPLDKIHELQKEQHSIERLELVHHQMPINYWTIPIYLVVILIGVYYTYQFLRTRLRRPQATSPTEEEQPEATSQAFFTP